MIAGLINACGKVASAVRAGTKIALGQHPSSPFQLMNLLTQFYSPTGAGAARSDGQLDNRASSIADSVNQSSRLASMQSARAAPPPQR